MKKIVENKKSNEHNSSLTIFQIIMAFVMCCIMLYIISVCNHVKTFNQHLNVGEEITICPHDPESFDVFFKPYDLSVIKNKVTINRPQNIKSNNRNDSIYIKASDACEISSIITQDYDTRYGKFRSIIPTKGILKDEIEKKHIPSSIETMEFYVKPLKSEDLQSIRNFFLTEILAFFIAVLALRIKSYIRQKITAKQRKGTLNLRRIHINLMRIGIFITISLMFVIYIISMPATCKIINTLNYNAENDVSIFKPYDISRIYYQYNVFKWRDSSITWKDNKELVEFSQLPEEFQDEPNGFTTWHNLKEGPYNFNFYVDFLESRNVQDIRLFLATTLLIIIISATFMQFCKVYNISWTSFWNYITRNMNKK